MPWPGNMADRRCRVTARMTVGLDPHPARVLLAKPSFGAAAKQDFVQNIEASNFETATLNSSSTPDQDAQDHLRALDDAEIPVFFGESRVL